MRVARLHGPGDLRLHDEPEPEPGVGEALVRVTTVGLCGSDRHWFLDGAIGETRVDKPLVLGHEIAGVVASGPRRGQRVAVEPADPCGECATCLAGVGHLCPTTRFAGHGTTDGGLRELTAWPARLLVPIPDAVGDDDAALLEPLGIALHALDLGKLRPESTAAVIGCGPIGLLLIQVLAARGCRRIAAIEPLSHRRDAALACGATSATPAVSPSDAPVDVAFEAAGEDDAVAAAVDLVGPGGRVVLVGIPAGDDTTFPASVARRKGLTILLSRRMAPGALERAVELTASGGVRPGRIISARHPLEDVAQAFGALVEQGDLKILVEPA
jgi:L-iditol 2-dehydrogenase